MIGFDLGIVQQFVGINIMMYYGTSILMKVGFGHQAPLIANISNGLTSFITTIAGMKMMYTVERRKMLLVGIIGTGSSMFLLTLAITFLSQNVILPYFVILLTMSFLAFFQSCISPTTWVLLSEICPQSLRGLAFPPFVSGWRTSRLALSFRSWSITGVESGHLPSSLPVMYCPGSLLLRRFQKRRGIRWNRSRWNYVRVLITATIITPQ